MPLFNQGRRLRSSSFAGFQMHNIWPGQLENEPRKMRGKPLSGRIMLALCILSFFAGSLFSKHSWSHPSRNIDRELLVTSNHVSKVQMTVQDRDDKSVSYILFWEHHVPHERCYLHCSLLVAVIHLWFYCLLCVCRKFPKEIWVVSLKKSVKLIKLSSKLWLNLYAGLSSFFRFLLYALLPLIQLLYQLDRNLGNRSLDKTVTRLEQELLAARTSQYYEHGFKQKASNRSAQRAFAVVGINTAFSSKKRRDSLRETWMPTGSNPLVTFHYSLIMSMLM